MKAILKILFLCGIIVLTAFSCEKEDIPELTDFVEGYIVGTFKCDETESETGPTTRITNYGYCILIDGSQNTSSHWPMDFYTFNLPDNLFDFPNKNMTIIYDGSNCGPMFFPDSLKSEYKIKFRYRDPKKPERIFFFCGACTAMDLEFPWRNYSQVTLDNITKINQ